MPANLATLTKEQFEESVLASTDRKGFYTPTLMDRLKEKKLLHWIITHPDDVSRANFLMGAHKKHFEQLQDYDLVELRAVYAVLPPSFSPDVDGGKRKWREAFVSTLKNLIVKVEALETAAAAEAQAAAAAAGAATSSSSSSASSSLGKLKSSVGTVIGINASAVQASQLRRHPAYRYPTQVDIEKERAKIRRAVELLAELRDLKLPAARAAAEEAKRAVDLAIANARGENK